MDHQTHFVNFLCPYCQLQVSSFTFKTHCYEIHGLNCENKCIWCIGAVQNPTEFHTKECLKNFLHGLPNVFCISIENLYKPCQYNVMGLHRKLSVKLKFPPLQHKGIELAIFALRKFLDEDHNWFHIKCEKQKTFLQVVNKLPFSSVCGTFQHYIVFISKENNPKKYLKGISKTQIKTPMAFVKALEQVSRGGSLCNFFPGKVSSEVEISLPDGFSVMCALQWPEGLMELIHHWFENVDAITLAPVAESYNGLWGVRIRDLPGLPDPFVIPVDKRLEPSSDRGDFEIEMPNKRILFFNWNFSLDELNLNEWLKYQDFKGNSVFKDIYNEIWYPTYNQQKTISTVKNMYNNIRKANKEIKRLDAKIKTLENSIVCVQDSSEQATFSKKCKLN